MTSIIHDHKAIGRIANLRALDGRPQSEDKPVEMPCDVNPQPGGFMSPMDVADVLDGAVFFDFYKDTELVHNWTDYLG